MYDNNEENKKMNDERVDGEYSFSYNNERSIDESERVRAYSDAGYIPASEAPKVPPNITAITVHQNKTRRKKRKVPLDLAGY